MNTPPEWWANPRKVTVVVDNESWILPYAKALVQAISDGGDNVCLARQHTDIQAGGVAFYLGCTRITPPDVLAKNHKNLVIHASNLPKGRGFSPMTWLILEGENTIPVCLIEATESVDAGPIVLHKTMQLRGDELNAETRLRLGQMHIDMCLEYLNSLTPPEGRPQDGEPTLYRRRYPQDSELDPNKTLLEQFNLLRIVDNDRYPAFFKLHGKTYVLKIEKAEEQDAS